MRKKFFIKSAILCSIIVAGASFFGVSNADAATSNSINQIGTFHDNSWDGTSLSKIKLGKDDLKKNLVHDYKVVKGKVIETGHRVYNKPLTFYTFNNSQGVK